MQGKQEARKRQLVDEGMGATREQRWRVCIAHVQAITGFAEFPRATDLVLFDLDVPSASVLHRVATGQCKDASASDIVLLGDQELIGRSVWHIGQRTKVTVHCMAAASSMASASSKV